MSRSDKFEDQYEGTFSEPTYEEIRKLSIDNPDFLKFYKTHREQVAISSWHINEYRLHVANIHAQETRSLQPIAKCTSSKKQFSDCRDFKKEFNYFPASFIRQWLKSIL
jgi:hypothetical protein